MTLSEKPVPTFRITFYQAGLGIRAAAHSSSIAIEAKAVAVCFSAPSIRPNTSAATTATWRPGVITLARHIVDQEPGNTTMKQAVLLQ